MGKKKRVPVQPKVFSGGGLNLSSQTVPGGDQKEGGFCGGKEGYLRETIAFTVPELRQRKGCQGEFLIEEGRKKLAKETKGICEAKVTCMIREGHYRFRAGKSAHLGSIRMPGTVYRRERTFERREERFVRGEGGGGEGGRATRAAAQT